MKVHEIYKDMIQAANKARKASADYNARDSFLTHVKDYNDIQKEDDHYLKKYYNRYSFWRGEQIRLGELIKAQKAYYELRMYEQNNDQNSDYVTARANQLLDRGIVPTEETLYGGRNAGS